MHTSTMDINIGVPVLMDRKECDANFRKDCSNGLHVGATKYVENFAKSNSTILMCLVNPANVVAVPDYDHSKMRVSEYYPLGVAKYENNKIEIVEQTYFESDYICHEEAEVAKQIKLIQSNEKPIETAMDAEPETRPMSELLKILESRLIDL